MKRIPLTQGGFALVDDEDYERTVKLTWRLSPNKGKPYAYTSLSKKVIKTKAGNSVNQSLQTFILNRFHKGRNTVILFKDGNRLNCTKENLFVGSEGFKSQGVTGMVANKKSRFKGVRWCDTTKRWRASIIKNKKCYDLGRHDTEEEAALTYNKKAIELYGENAKLNKI